MLKKFIRFFLIFFIASIVTDIYGYISSPETFHLSTIYILIKILCATLGSLYIIYFALDKKKE